MISSYSIAIESPIQSHCNKQLVITNFQANNILGINGPRKMRVLLPKLESNGDPTPWRPLIDEDTMITKFKHNDTSNMKVYINKSPVWNDGKEQKKV